MKEEFDLIQKRLRNQFDTLDVDGDNDWNCAMRQALSIVSEVEAEYINKSTEHINKLRDCSSVWIPCSERLPDYDISKEYYDSVIVTLDTGRVAEGCYRNFDGQWWVDAEDGEHFSINATGHVVAWMPLPEPYNPEKGE